MIAGQAFRFVLVGLAQIAVDAAAFVALTYAGAPVAPSNIAARVSGAALGFALNRRFTFRGGGRGLGGAGLRFATLWGVMTCVSTVLVGWTSGALGLEAAWLAKPLVDGALAAISFFATKWWVFRA